MMHWLACVAEPNMTNTGKRSSTLLVLGYLINLTNCEPLCPFLLLPSLQSIWERKGIFFKCVNIVCASLCVTIVVHIYNAIASSDRKLFFFSNSQFRFVIKGSPFFEQTQYRCRIFRKNRF